MYPDKRELEGEDNGTLNKNTNKKMIPRTKHIQIIPPSQKCYPHPNPKPFQYTGLYVKNGRQNTPGGHRLRTIWSKATRGVQQKNGTILRWRELKF